LGPRTGPRGARGQAVPARRVDATRPGRQVVAACSECETEQHGGEHYDCLLHTILLGSLRAVSPAVALLTGSLQRVLGCGRLWVRSLPAVGNRLLFVRRGLV